jgi:hypothetical protein
MTAADCQHGFSTVHHDPRLWPSGWRPLAQRSADFPLMAEWIENPAQPPAVHVGHLGCRSGASLGGLGEHRVRIIDHEQVRPVPAMVGDAKEVLPGLVNGLMAQLDPDRAVTFTEVGQTADRLAAILASPVTVLRPCLCDFSRGPAHRW